MTTNTAKPRQVPHLLVHLATLASVLALLFVPAPWSFIAHLAAILVIGSWLVQRLRLGAWIVGEGARKELN